MRGSNRLQLEAMQRFDAFGEVRRTTGAARPRMLLLFMPQDHVMSAGSFRQFARLTGADTVAFASLCGHMAPVCETAAIGEHVRRYLEDVPGSIPALRAHVLQPLQRMFGLDCDARP